jgi:hypothetical protein
MIRNAEVEGSIPFGPTDSNLRSRKRQSLPAGGRRCGPEVPIES